MHNMKKVIYRLESYYTSQATDVEKTVIKYILDNIRETTEMDIHTLAKRGYCSPATIVRISKKIGFRGFKELKIALLNDINFNDELVRSNLSNLKSSDEESIVREIFNENIRSLNNTYNLIDYDQISKIVKLIDESKVIRLFGLGASFLVAKDFQQKLERINKLTVLYEDTHLQMINSMNISKNEVAIVISYSGQTHEILEMARNIKLNNGILISITKYSNNKLFSMSDYSLNVPNIEKNLRAAASSSRISQLIIIDILYNTYLEMYKDEFLKRIIKTNEMLGKEE